MSLIIFFCYLADSFLIDSNVLAEKLSFQQIDRLTEFSGETLLDYKEINMIIEPSAERLILQKTSAER